MAYFTKCEGSGVGRNLYFRKRDMYPADTPLYWDEVTKQLRPETLIIPDVINQINNIGDPFIKFRDGGEKQEFKSVLNQMNGLS